MLKRKVNYLYTKSNMINKYQSRMPDKSFLSITNFGKYSTVLGYIQLIYPVVLNSLSNLSPVPILTWSYRKFDCQTRVIFPANRPNNRGYWLMTSLCYYTMTMLSYVIFSKKQNNSIRILMHCNCKLNEIMLVSILQQFRMVMR